MPTRNPHGELHMRPPHGLHHVTAIAGPAQENLDFYAGVLGMRLVKKSVNQDDPGTYHLFYADAEGRPGTDLTFFPWSRHAPARDGHGLSVEVALAVPAGSLAFWTDRLAHYGTTLGKVEQRFGRAVLPLTDPHGLRVALVETDEAAQRPFTPWESSPVPPERQVRGLESARMREHDLGPTTAFLTRRPRLQFHRRGKRVASLRRQRRRVGGIRRSSGGPTARRGAWGVGSIHHLAWRVADGEHQLALRDRVARAARQPTPVIDRFWFQSVYFLEPGGVLFELATDGPGFAVDEEPAHLGESLVLPPWLESQRAAIEAGLPALRSPVAAEK